MSFCWFTSFIGYPNFFKGSGRGHELAQSFLAFAKASIAGKSYKESKKLFPDLGPHKVETKKAAFQEFGLLYVIPRSDTVSLTPLGAQVYGLCSKAEGKEPNRRTILFALSRGLMRYQFNNPLPVGGNRLLSRAVASDVLPYLAAYYLMLRLGGILTVSELRGAIFGISNMADIRHVETQIHEHRKSRTVFDDLPTLPTHRGTADNLKIYFVSHLSLDNEIMTSNIRESFYGIPEQVLESTQFGYEIIEAGLDEQWPGWRHGSSKIPVVKSFASVDEYFLEGIGKSASKSDIELVNRKAERIARQISEGVLDVYDIEALKELEKRKFEEGRRRLIQHARVEKVRNSSLIRTAKFLFKKNHGRFFCELCKFDFEKKYSKRGKDYIEAHHKIPISEIEENTTLTVSDIVMVCSNCHRMLHRPPWVTVEELRESIGKTHGAA